MRSNPKAVKCLRGAWREVLGLCLMLLLCTSAPARAALSPELQKGMDWLQAQVRADGGLAGESASIATPLQARAEALTTFKLLGTIPTTLAGSIAANTDDNSEYLARQLISSSLAGQTIDGGVVALLARQNADGGFGGDAGSASNPLDTAWVLFALVLSGQGDTGPALGMRSYLASAILADGGVDGSSESERIEVSALALLALQTSQPDLANANIVKNLSAWLLQLQGANGSWESGAYTTAFVLSAIAPMTGDATVLSNARAFLLSRQLADGSWNEDPFLTALALRALSTQSAPPATTGILKGQVKDAVTNAPLSNVSVALSGQGNQAAVTDPAGSFTIAGLTAGSYSAGYTRNGYSTASANYTITAGQTTDAGTISLTQTATAGIIRGQVTSATGNTPLPGVTISVTGAMTASTTTDANGRYEFSGVNPGAMVIAASVTGYQTLSGSGTVTAGQTQVFSPTLYANGQTAPTTAHYVGTVVSAGQALPLAGVAVHIAGTSNAAAVTTANGQFDVTLSPGSYSASFSLTGYGSVSQTFVVAAGTTLNVGNVFLSPILTSTSISGRVVDASGRGIAGAWVQVIGLPYVATSFDGSYTIDNIADSSISLRASATGFNSQTINLQIPAPSRLVQNFALTPQNGGSLSLADLVVTPGSVGSSANVTVATTISNTGLGASTAIVELLVSDSNRNVISSGIAYDANGILLGIPVIAPGQHLGVKLVWNSAQFLPGVYSLTVRLVEPNSMTQTLSQGNVLAERASSVTVSSQSHFTGTITANPSALPAGTNTPVKLHALIHNDGNLDLAAQTLTLKILNSKDGSIVLTQNVAVAKLLVNDVKTLTIPDWTPVQAGNFNLQLAGTDTTLGKIEGTLYVGDAASATYSVDRPVVPTGTQTVRGTVKVTGQDRLGGIATDLSVTFPANVTMANPNLVPSNSTRNADGTTTAVWHLAAVLGAGQEISFDLTVLNLLPNEVRSLATDAHLTFNNAFTSGHNYYVPTSAAGGPLPQCLIPAVSGDTPLSVAIASVAANNLVTGPTCTGVCHNPETLVSVTESTYTVVSNCTQIMYVGQIFKCPVGQLFYNDTKSCHVVDPGKQDVNLSIEIPTVTASPYLDLKLSSDKPQYGANASVNLNALVTNTGAAASSGAVDLAIYAADGILVQDLGPQSFTALAPATQRSLSATWNTGSYAVGTYTVVGTMFDVQSRKVGEARASFNIVGPIASALVGAKITTDKQSYPPSDTVKLLDRISNLSLNQTFNGLSVVTQVYSPNGSVLWTQTTTLTQLPPAGFKDLSNGVALAMAAAGSYRAVLSVKDAGGTVLAQSETAFTVQSSADSGSGLTGSVSAATKQVSQGDPLLIASTVNNLGNAATTGLPITLSVIDPATQAVVTSWPATVSLAKGATYQSVQTWMSGSGKVNTTYMAVLTAQIGGKTLTLGSDSFTVTGPPVKLDVKQQLLREGRLLVLLSCKNGEGNGQNNTQSGGASAQTTSANGNWQSDSDDDKNCINSRAQFLDRTLSAFGIDHWISATLADFKLAFRSGKYNSYWLSGGALKLDNDLTRELREAVNRGDSLLLDGIHDERNGLLDEVPGVLYRGNLATSNLPITFTGALFVPGLIAPTGARPLVLALDGGTQQATYVKCHGCRNGTSAAIVSNTYGNGRGMVMAFDLLDILMQTQPIPAVWQDILHTTFSYLTPQTPDAFTAGAYAVARTTLTNQGQAVALDVTDLPPLGAFVVSTTPQASVNPTSSQAEWTPNLAVGQSIDLTAALRVPETSANYTLTTVVNSISNGQSKLYGSYPLTIKVAAAADLVVTNLLIADLNALPLSSSPDRNGRDQAVKNLQDAISKTAQGQYEDALASLLDAIDKLRDITGKDVGVYRLAIDRWMQELELEWLYAPPSGKH